MIVGYAILLAISLFMAWRYARMALDPDMATYLLPAMTDAVYGRDFSDCKTPAIYAWFYGLRLLVGKSIPRIKFINHLLIGAGGGFLVLWLTGDFWKALAFTVLINSGFLLAFHGNVSQLPAVFLVVALAVPNPWIAATAGALAVLVEPKLLFAYAAMVVIYGWWVPGAALTAIGLVGAGLMRWRWPKQWGWIWESSVVMPIRVKVKRAVAAKRYNWVPPYTANALLYFLPWVAFGVWGNPSILYWLPAILYLFVIGWGIVIRQNHLFALVPWVALAQTNPQMVFALTLIDWTAAGFYVGLLWVRFYSGLNGIVHETRRVGEKMKGRTGTMWVNGMYSSIIYAYSGKRPIYGMLENIELNVVSTERRRKMTEAWRARPAEWVVETPVGELVFSRKGYKNTDLEPLCSVWHREVPDKG